MPLERQRTGKKQRKEREKEITHILTCSLKFIIEILQVQVRNNITILLSLVSKDTIGENINLSSMPSILCKSYYNAASQ
jgi:hypothetical protein